MASRHFFVQSLNEIIIYGSSFNSDQDPVPNTELDVLITVGEISRVIPVLTDASANYSFAFVPLPTEAGHYEVRANYPGQNGKDPQDSFDILGVEINGGDPFKWELILNQEVNSTVEIKNLSNTPLTNLVVSPVSLPNGCTLSFGNLAVLDANESLPLSYTVIGAEVTPMEEDQEVDLLITTDEGVAQQWKSDYHCQDLAAHISASISSINTTYNKDTPSFLEFELYNIGLGGTGDIVVDIPEVDWMTLTSMEVIPNLASGDTTLVILQFLPSENLPLNTPATGNLVISAANGNQLNMPFGV